MKALSVSLSLLALATLCPSLHAQEAYTDPVGFVSVTVPAQSDAVLAVPLYRAAAFRGSIQSISGSQITLSGTPNWTTNQYVQAIGTQNDTFAVIVASGTKEGMIGKITANTAGTVTVQLDAGDDFTSVKTETSNPGSADQIDIVPYWTPASLMGSTLTNGSRLLLFPTNLSGVNIAADTIVLKTPSGWFIAGVNSDNYPLGFGQGFVFRNQTNGTQTISMVGSVPMVAHRFILRKLSAPGTAQDIRIGYSSPVPEKIGSLGLGFTSGDRLLVFDNSAAGMNKSASINLLYSNGVWLNAGVDVTNSFELQPGFGYVFRRASAAPTGSVVWTDIQSYLQ